ncbi:antirestriction protein ArdA [Leifsonia aquatica]|uniref:antirestriction protein ArdA n=1 Tax=Leifsonia aquatica TaxID=144185 RepID=UPI00046862A0|nr:antirestriction protein ArdA [Leifsonia aquatica]
MTTEDTTPDDGRSVVAYDNLDRALTIWGATFYDQTWTAQEKRYLLDEAEAGFDATNEDPDGFRVWVSTFGLYNAGSLAGYWVAAEHAPTTVPEFIAGMVIRNHSVGKSFLQNVGEELNCFDIENSPVDAEMHPSAAKAWAEAINATIADQGDQVTTSLIVTFIRDHTGGIWPDDLTSTFDDRFHGFWEDGIASWWVENVWETWVAEYKQLAEHSYPRVTLPDWLEYAAWGIAKSQAEDYRLSGWAEIHTNDGVAVFSE